MDSAAARWNGAKQALTDFGFQGNIAADEPLAAHCTFGFGGPARLFAEPADHTDIHLALALARERGWPVFVLGGGSNILAPDAGLDGLVLCTAGRLKGVSLEQGLIRALAGTTDLELSCFAREHGLRGFEWLCDIPGTAGGAVYMNAGNNEGVTADSLVSVRWIDPEGRVHESAAADLALGYRTSVFQTSPGLVLECVFRPAGEDSPASINGRMEESRRRREACFPPEKQSAGSVFKRPPGHYAGKLIEEAGCGGLRVGGAKVSEKHKGFIVNSGGGSCADVKALIAEVRRRVFEHSGIQLEPEVRYFEELRFL